MIFKCSVVLGLALVCLLRFKLLLLWSVVASLKVAAFVECLESLLSNDVFSSIHMGCLSVRLLRVTHFCPKSAYESASLTVTSALLHKFSVLGWQVLVPSPPPFVQSLASYARV